MANKKATKPLSRTQRVRILLKEGRSTQEIAATVGVTAQFVYNVQYSERKKAKDDEAKAEAVRISPKTGKPVRKYTKRKKADKKNPLIDERNLLLWDRKRLQDELADAAESMVQMRQEISELRDRPPVTIELPVPQPFSHYTFMQRLGILFLGRTPA